MDRSRNKVLVFSAQTSRLEATVSFLKRRGWTVLEARSLREALSQILTDHPNFIFISIHLPDIQIRTVQALCSKYQNLEVIAFSESSTTESVYRLANCGLTHILYPPVGGPAFDRCLKRFVLETYAPRIGPQTEPEDENSEPVYWPYGSNPRIKLSALQRSVLYRAIQRAVEQASQPDNQIAVSPLAVVNKVSYFEVLSQNYSGYVVIASPAGRSTDLDFAKAVKEFLFESLEIAGDRVSESEAREVSVEQVDFKEWAKKYAAFHKTINHNGEELGIAFFAVDNLAEEPQANEYHLIPVELSRIEAHRVIHFDIYLHLPLNGRYIRYVRKGERLMIKQKLNLASRSVDKVFVRKRDLPQWRHFLAQQFFDETITKCNNQTPAAA